MDASLVGKGIYAMYPLKYLDDMSRFAWNKAGQILYDLCTKVKWVDAYKKGSQCMQFSSTDSEIENNI